MRRLTKIKIKTTKGGHTKIEVGYQQPPHGEADEWDDYSICSSAPARPELHEALAALVPLVCEDLELPEDYAKEMRVSSVTCTWTNDIMGATVCCLKQLSTADSPLVLNTPHKPSEPYGGEGAGGALLSEEMTRALSWVEDEALRYVAGDRAQMALDLGSATVEAKVLDTAQEVDHLLSPEGLTELREEMLTT